ncbi:MAG: arylesterase [Candidatus Taylorbacteria bacterium]|nr:arylesterase [Candidatus Taylorbacteria bacterium]
MTSNKKLVLAGLVAAVGLALFFAYGRDAKITNYPPKDGPIVAFGDSLVEGVGANKGGDLVSLLSNMIKEPIANLGVSGNTSADALARIDRVLEKEPRLVIVLLGGNDFLRKVAREETFANLRQIVRKIQSKGAIVLLLGVRSNLLADNAAEYYEALAKETGSAYVPDVLDGIFGDSRYMADSIHPNSQGYARVAERVYPVLFKLLK